MKEAAGRLRGHPYSYRQGYSLIPVALHPVFTYSVGLASWTTSTLQSLHNLWGLMGRRAWALTEGHNVAPFLTQGAEGGVAQDSPYHLAARNTLQLLHKACGGLHDDILRLVQVEWVDLCRTWGTTRPQEIQAALLLLDSTMDARTLLSRTLYYLGHVGIVLSWEQLPGLTPPAPYAPSDDPMSRPLLGALWSYVRYMLSTRWEMRMGAESNAALATGIRNLVRQGIKQPRQLWSSSGGGWRIHANLSQAETNTILLALEHSFTGTRRYSVLDEVTDPRRVESTTDLNVTGEALPPNSPEAPSTPREVGSPVDLCTPQHPTTASTLCAQLFAWAGSVLS